MAKCCACPDENGATKSASPFLCIVPRGEVTVTADGKTAPSASTPKEDFQFLSPDYIKKHFKLPPRAMYLDHFRRPLITFPVNGENTANFNTDRKAKINQMILDGMLDPSEAISAPSVFPYPPANAQTKKDDEADEEVIYILQLPDMEMKCPVHNQTIKTPRFIWHSCKKPKKADGGSGLRRGAGPVNRPKPWILSRHTDFDYQSQW